MYNRLLHYRFGTQKALKINESSDDVHCVPQKNLLSSVCLFPLLPALDAQQVVDVVANLYAHSCQVSACVRVMDFDQALQVRVLYTSYLTKSNRFISK